MIHNHKPSPEPSSIKVLEFFVNQIIQLTIFYIIFLLNILPDNSISVTVRGFAVSLFLPNRPKGLKLGRDVTLLNAKNLHLGDNVYIAKSSWVNAKGSVYIGSNTCIGPNVIIASTKHLLTTKGFAINHVELQQIIIHDNCWICGNCTVTSGVTIYHSAIVGANSVVTTDLPPCYLSAGNPARKIKPVHPA